MSTVVAPSETEEEPDINGGTRWPDSGPPGGGGGDPWGGQGFPARFDPYGTAVWIFLVPVLLFFAGLTRAMVVLHRSSAHWVPVHLPGMIYGNTVVLLASSLALEVSRARMRAAARSFPRWLWVTALLGFSFLVGQAWVWKQLPPANPPRVSLGTAFFYLLTMTHGVHLLAALAPLIYLAVRQARREMTPRRRSAYSATALFWHFMAMLWLYILVLLTWFA